MRVVFEGGKAGGEREGGREKRKVRVEKWEGGKQREVKNQN